MGRRAPSVSARSSSKAIEMTTSSDARPQIHDSVSSAVEDLTGKSPTSLRDVITAARRDAASV